MGGPNAGHTFLLPNGEKVVTQTVPAPCFVNSETDGVIGAAGLVIPHILVKELAQAHNILGKPVRLFLDENVGIITNAHMADEAHLKGNIGSTGEGVGAATAAKVMREPNLVVKSPNAWTMLKREMAKDSTACRGVALNSDTPMYLNSVLRDGGYVMIEGTQGVELSLHTARHYPFCTSRECTPQGMLAQTGISPDNANIFEKIMVVRTYPIRVGGNSGDLPGELTWKALKEKTGGYVKEAEITTVTKKKRRIGEIDFAALTRAVRITRPTGLALTFFDYWFPEIATATDSSALKKKHWTKINEVENTLGVDIKYLSTGFGTVIPLRVTL